MERMAFGQLGELFELALLSFADRCDGGVEASGRSDRFGSHTCLDFDEMFGQFVRKANLVVVRSDWMAGETWRHFTVTGLVVPLTERQHSVFAVPQQHGHRRAGQHDNRGLGPVAVTQGDLVAHSQTRSHAATSNTGRPTSCPAT